MKILNEILKDVIVLESKGNVDVSIYSVSLDSRNIENNSLFIAIKGNILDGHNFINEVIEKGAKVIVHEKDITEFKSGITYIRVSDTHSSAGIIAGNFYGNPSRNLKLVGVTGTNGKTTTVTLLHQLFTNLGHKTGLISTVVDKICNETIVTNRVTPTTPDAFVLNKLLAEMVDKGCTYCFMEVSSHAMVEGRVSGINFTGGLFTNLTLDHLDYHKTLDDYASAKKEFFDIIPSYGFAIANIDDERGEYMLSTTKAKTYTLSLKKNVDSSGNEVNFKERLETKLIGEFNAYNILGIYAVAVLLEQDKSAVKEIIKNLDGAPGRFQAIKSQNRITGIVDYAHTPDALENVLKTANDIKKDGRLIALVGCGGDRDKTKRPIMARIGYDLADILILTSDNPRTEKPEDILNDMQKGLPVDDNKTYIIEDRQQAIQKACELARSGDYILIAGKGHENYQEVNGVKHHFDDMEELEKYLK